jgi:hypothetical protein
MDDLAIFYKKKYDFLFDFNLEILYVILNLLEVNVNVRLTDEYIPIAGKNVNDMRELIHPKKPYQADPDFTPFFYNQVFNYRHGFLPNLSIIDLIFNEGSEAVEVLKKKYPFKIVPRLGNLNLQ